MGDWAVADLRGAWQERGGGWYPNAHYGDGWHLQEIFFIIISFS